MKSEIKNAFTEENVERWFGVWDYSGQVIYENVEQNMETNTKKNRAAVGTHHFKFNNDGSIDADYVVVDENNRDFNMRNAANSPNNDNDDDEDERKKKEEFVKMKDRDYF